MAKSNNAESDKPDSDKTSETGKTSADVTGSDAKKTSDAKPAGRNRKAAEPTGSAKKGSGKSGNPAKRTTNRKTAAYTSTPGTQTIKPNGRWFVPTMVSVLLLGLAWLVVFYISSGNYPVGAWGYWNLGVGFGVLVVGLVMSTRWR